MFYVAIIILASFLWALTNHIDKFMVGDVNESTNGVKTLLVFSTFIAGIVFSPIWLIINKFSVSISIISFISILAASFIYVIATYFYFKALEENDASTVVIIFQLIPVFSYILALVLFNETLTLKQIIGAIVIILSSIIISLDFNEKNDKRKLKALILMTISSLLFSIYYIFFDVAIRDSSYNSCAFWFQIGLFMQGIILMCIKSFRSNFIKAIKTNGKRYISLNITNESINLAGILLVNFANVFIPISIVNVLSGFQCAFSFIIGFLGVKFLPKFFKEELSRKVIIQKVSCIILSIIGLSIMFI